MSGPRAGPELEFDIVDAGIVEFAAVPTLRFMLRIACVSGEPIRALSLDTQLRIAAERRHYETGEQERLAELFGAPELWADSLRSLLWVQTSLQVPRFTGTTVVEMPVACTYDFEVKAAKYFHGLEAGAVPLDFLFSGSIFYADASGRLRTTRIPRDREASYRMPIRLWQELMERHFPGAAWLRLDRDTFDRLYRYRAERALPSWEATLDELLEERLEEA